SSCVHRVHETGALGLYRGTVSFTLSDGRTEGTDGRTDGSRGRNVATARFQRGTNVALRVVPRPPVAATLSALTSGVEPSSPRLRGYAAGPIEQSDMDKRLDGLLVERDECGPS